jgi:capsular exopolysaccharide synthesis family protein
VTRPNDRLYRIRGILAVLRSHWLLITICGVVCLGAVVAYDATRPNEYASTSTLLFRQTNLDTTVLNGSPYFAQQVDPDRQAATNLELVGTPAIADSVAATLGGSITADDVYSTLSFGQQGNSDIVGITSTSTNPDLAARVANAWAAEFVTFRRASDRRQVEDAIALVRKELTLAQADGTSTSTADELRQNLQRLKIVQSLQTGDVQVLEQAVASAAPLGLPLPVIAATALIIGLLIGAGVSYWGERLDKSLKEVDQAGDALGLPLLTSIPRLRGKGRSGGQSLADEPLAREAFRTLGVRLRFFNLESDRRVIAITSATPSEGKTFTALNMALTSALAGKRTLLIDADLRLGDISERLGVPGGSGLSRVLSGQATLEDSLIAIDPEGLVRTNVDDPFNREDPAELVVLPRGPVPPNPVQMLASRRMSELLVECRETFECVIIDTAPLLRVSDAETLLSQSDGFIVVTRLARSQIDDLVRLSAVLDDVRDKALGLIVNDVPMRGFRSGDAYAYAYAEGQPRAKGRAKR